MGACARNMQSDPAEIKPAQCCIKLVFHLTYTMMHGSTKLKCRSKLSGFYLKSVSIQPTQNIEGSGILHAFGYQVFHLWAQHNKDIQNTLFLQKLLRTSGSYVVRCRYSTCPVAPKVSFRDQGVTIEIINIISSLHKVLRISFN